MEIKKMHQQARMHILKDKINYKVKIIWNKKEKAVKQIKWKLEGKVAKQKIGAFSKKRKTQKMIQRIMKKMKRKKKVRREKE